MRDELHDTAYLNGARQTDALDALLSELIAQQPDPSPAIRQAPVSESRADATMPADTTSIEAISLDHAPADAGSDDVIVLEDEKPTAEAAPPVETAPETSSEPAQEALPARVYSIADLMLFEQLTGYRLVAQRQLWRSVDKLGNRAIANDRLFTVLAEETFQIADRNRRNGPLPRADLTLHDLALAMKPMRGIAAHLGERGIQAWDRLEVIVLAALDRRKAA